MRLKLIERDLDDETAPVLGGHLGAFVSSDATFAAAREVFGEAGAAELVFLVASCASVSVLLNGFAVSVPGGEQ